MYNYQNERPTLFTEEGMKMVLKIRDNVDRLLKEAGAVRSQEAQRGVTGDGWTMLAALDYLVETRYLVEVTGKGVWGQHRVFVGPMSR